MTAKKPRAAINDVDLIPPQDLIPDPYVEDPDYDEANDDVDLEEAGADLRETPDLPQPMRFTADMLEPMAAFAATAVSTLALVGPHIQAKGYTKGRSPMVERPVVNVLVLHTAEGATDEMSLGSFFSRVTTGSSQAGIGQDGGYATYVNYADTAWCAPPLNQEGEHLEICAFAKWTREQWLANMPMLESVARWIAWRCSVRRIPVVLLSDADLKAGKAGVTDHDAVSDVWKKSDHWDVGESFPWDVVIPRAQQLAGVGGEVAPAAKYHVVVKGDTLSSIARKYSSTVTARATANALKSPYTLQIGQRIKVVGGAATPTQVRGVRGRFPYPSDHYFYTTTADRRCHSGFGTEGADETYIRWIQEEVGASQDGEYGPNTRDKVYAWQGRVGLRRDGVFGPVSWGRAAAT